MAHVQRLVLSARNLQAEITAHIVLLDRVEQAECNTLNTNIYTPAFCHRIFGIQVIQK